MIFNKIHNRDLYNTLLKLSRNSFFYKNISLPDSFETRIYLMFIHFSLILIIFKAKKIKFDQKEYDYLFYNIEYNLRELGFGDVTVNKKMKDLNKVLYDILLKIEIKNKKDFTLHINHTLICKYFPSLSDQKSSKYTDFETYFLDFYNFCFEIPVKNMIRDIINKY
tara:strand:+ start:386 stop:883 length:498 start_codon:yes stop_codon:yes gene_type:complete